MTRMSAARVVKWAYVVTSILAAVLWLQSARLHIPHAPGAAIVAASPHEPFNVALRHVAVWNKWAAIATGLSLLLLVVAEILAERRARARLKGPEDSQLVPP